MTSSSSSLAAPFEDDADFDFGDFSGVFLEEEGPFFFGGSFDCAELCASQISTDPDSTLFLFVLDLPNSNEECESNVITEVSLCFPLPLCIEG